MKLALAATFFATALLYASVGFGGGSTYTALLVVTGTPYYLIPVIALTCNILVVSGNVWRYGREGLINISKIWPLIFLSVPAAWIGGRLNVSETVFIGLLWVALAVAGTRLLFTPSPQTSGTPIRNLPIWQTALIGGGIGFYSGLVGIGGGIFLAPVLHALKWDTSRNIAAKCSLFILVNSLSGLWGQMTKLGALDRYTEALPYWPVIPAVLIGGFIGNHWGVFKLSDTVLKRVTGILILIVAIRLALRWFGMV